MSVLKIYLLTDSGQSNRNEVDVGLRRHGNR